MFLCLLPGTRNGEETLLFNFAHKRLTVATERTYTTMHQISPLTVACLREGKRKPANPLVLRILSFPQEIMFFVQSNKSFSGQAISARRSRY